MKNNDLILFILFMTIILSACNRNTHNNTVGFAGQNLLNDVSVQRDKFTKKTTFISNLEGEWKLYAGTLPDSIDFSKPVLAGKGSGEFSLNVSLDKRSYFEIITPKAKAVLAERHLPMEGGFNFRDIGGYKTKENRYVKWGKMIRSDDLSKLTDADLKYLFSLQLLTIIDYRSTGEIKNAPDKIPASVKNNLTCSINPGNVTNTDFSANMLTAMDSTKIDAYMEQINREFVTDSSSIAQFKKMFDRLQNPDGNVPLLYHCTAGKDRTGMATALILYALGMDDKTIMDDYLLSNKFIDAKFADYIKQYPQLIGLFSVKSSYLQAGIDQIRKNHGSIESFLVNNLQVDFDKFKEEYLY